MSTQDVTGAPAPATPAGPRGVPNAATNQRLDSLADTLLKAGIAVVVLGFWLPSMAWGYLTDEHMTAWITQDGLGSAISRSQEHQGNSPIYYSAIWLIRQLLGGSAVVLRLPSVLAVLAAGYHLTRLGEELDRRTTGLIAAFVLIANGGVFIRAITARVYGVLLLLLILSARYLFRYLRTRRLSDGATWVVCSVASLYMTPFAAVILAAQIVPLATAAKEGTLPARHGSKLAALATLSALPLAPQVLDLALRSDTLAISTQPSISTAIGYMFPPILVFAALAGFLVGGWGGRLNHSQRSFQFAVAWIVLPVLLLFFMGVVASPVVSVTRYRLGVIPGAGILAGMVISRLRRPSGQLAAVGLLVILSLLQLVHHTNERQGWREATEWASEQISDDEDAILAFDYSLVEQFNVEQVADPEFNAYFTAPTLVYGVDATVRPLPLGNSLEAQQYIDDLFRELVAHDTIALVTKYVSPPPDYRSLFRERLLEMGYVETTGPAGGLVAALVFHR